MKGIAIFSSCKKYRYVLTRHIGGAKGPMLFIMLNPSTADAEKDDPTIRRCIGFAKREGVSTLTIVNLFAYRATDPKELKEVEDPVGPENDIHIKRELEYHRTMGAIIAAWGANPIAIQRGHTILKRSAFVLCMGKTKSGAPRHPLYIPSTAEFIHI